MAQPDAPNLVAAIEVRVELDSGLLMGLPEPERVLSTLRDALRQRVETLAAALGVPGRTDVIAGTFQSGAPEGRLFRLSVNGVHCRYPDELLLWVYSYLSGEHVDPAEQATTLVQRIRQRDETGLITFLADACLEVIKLQPASLLASAQAEAYAASLVGQCDPALANRAPAATWLMPVLQSVLDLRLSIADRPAMANTLAGVGGLLELEATERIITRLGGDRIGIHVSAEMMAQFAGADADSSGGLFKFLRDGMASEQGMLYPPFGFVVDEGLTPWSFAFCIGHLTTTPVLGLRPEDYLVNDTAERLLKLDPPIAARAAINPATGMPSAVIGSSDKARAERSGLTVWDSRQHLILSLAAALRTYGHCFVTTDFVTERLDKARHLVPLVVDAVKVHYSIEELTALLRSLVEEQVSIRNLHRLLDAAVEYAESGNDVGRGIDSERTAGPVRWASHDAAALAAWVRASAKGELKDKLGRGTDTVVAYLFDQKIEQLLSQELRRLPADQDIDRVLAALRVEFAYLPPTAQRPVLLTSHRSRAMLRKVVALEFPRLSVVAHGELPRDTNVQPVARIAFA